MSVSFYQIMFSESNGHFERANDSKSTPIYKLNALAQGVYFKQFAKEKYGHELYDFASDENLVEENEMPPLSTQYLNPDDILDDLKIYHLLLGAIKVELDDSNNELLAKEMKFWFLDHDKVSWIANEISELEKICNYAKAKKYTIKYACDY